MQEFWGTQFNPEALMTVQPQESYQSTLGLSSSTVKQSYLESRERAQVECLVWPSVRHACRHFTGQGREPQRRPRASFSILECSSDTAECYFPGQPCDAGEFDVTFTFPTGLTSCFLTVFSLLYYIYKGRRGGEAQTNKNSAREAS